MTTRKHLEDDSYRDARELNDRGKTERKSMDEEINEWNKINSKIIAERKDEYEKGFNFFRKLYEQTKDIMKDIDS